MLSSLKGKKVLVTGGFGFIGSHLARALLQAGASVTIVARKIPVDRESAALAKQVRIVIGDLQDEKVISEALSGNELVYHLAASTPFQKNYSEGRSIDDLTILFTLVKGCAVAGVRKIIFLSGHVVYGLPKKLPISEEHATIPVHLYGTGKLSAELYLQQLCNSHGIEFVIARASSCYGPGQMSKGAIPNFITAALDDKTLSVPDRNIKRDYLYVEDAVYALLACSQAKNKIYNIGGGQSYDLRTVAEIVVSLIGTGNIQARASDDPLGNNLLDISLAQKELGFFPKVELKEGLKKHLEWVKQKKNAPTFYVDFDGTLIDPFPRLYALHKKLCADFNIAAYSEVEFVNLKQKGVFDETWLAHFLSAEDVKKYLATKSEILESSEFLQHDVLFPFTRLTLEELKKKGQVILVTRRKHSENLQKQLHDLWIQHLFDGILVIGNSGGSKAELIKANTQLMSSNSFIIGDTEDDIGAGKELGIKTIAVTSGMRGAEFLEGLKPDYIVKDISEIFRLGLF